MKYKALLALALTLSGTGVAGAYDTGSFTVGSGDKQVKVDLDAAANVNLKNGTQAGTVNVTNTNGGVNVKTNVSVDGKPYTGTVNVTNANGTINANYTVNGVSGTVNVTNANGSLKVLLDGNNLDDNSRSAVINLSGNTVELIKSDEDLSAYNNVVVSSYSNIEDVKTDDKEVRVVFDQDAKFLGVFGTTLKTEVSVSNDDNTVTVHTPWYGFLFTKSVKKDDLEKSLSVNVSKNRSNGRIGVSQNGNSGSVNVQNRAKTVSVITSKVGQTGSVSVQSGDKKVDVNLSNY